MKLFYLPIILILLTNCTLLQKSARAPSSIANDCLTLASTFLDENRTSYHPFSNKWEKILESPYEEEKFLTYIHHTYPENLRNKIGDLAMKINGFHQQRLYLIFFIELERFKEASKPLYKKIVPQWEKQSWAYLYVDKFGVQIGNEKASFNDLMANLDYYQEKLGVNNLYLLPINDSPQLDGGYDVRNYQSIASELGGNTQFFEFIKQLHERDMHVMIDFVPGHTSREHEWFQRALKGEKKYINYYLNTSSDKSFTTVEENGNVYNVYQTDNGEKYRRLLLFPDIEKKHWQKEEIHSFNHKQDHYFYSSFYPFQKDLNLQNPDVLEEHLKTLAFWIKNGVSGIRADAISWWVKKEGTTGQHLDETFAVSEYFHTFLKNLDAETLFLPELVDSPETAAKYLGKTVSINGKQTGQNANAIFEFEKSVQVLYSGVSGDFDDYYKFLKRTQEITYPKNTLHLLYTGNHHDEIYLGFLSPQAKNNFQKIIQNAHGVIYKKGNSAGSMLSDLLMHDHYQMLQFYKFLFAHKGQIAIYQGSELGVANAWKQTYQTTFQMLEEMKMAGQISPNDQVFRTIEELKMDENALSSPPTEDSPITPFIDGRLLHRNTLYQKDIDAAKDGQNPFFSQFALLPKLKKLSPALNGEFVEEPLETQRRDIGSFVRRAINEKGNIIDEVAVIKNGSNQETVIYLNIDQLTSKPNFRLFELEYRKNIPYQITDDGKSIRLKIRPYETLWLKIE